MYYANTDVGKIAAEPGIKGFCPMCASEMIPKCGEINAHHWAHKALGDCDTWSDGETAWT
jgi:competence protein CoiA